MKYKIKKFFASSDEELASLLSIEDESEGYKTIQILDTEEILMELTGPDVQITMSGKPIRVLLKKK